MHNSVKSSFSRPAAQRKIGWRAWNRYLIGILFAALWFWLISIPAIIQQSETFENWPERLVVLSPADLEALPKGTFDNSSRAIEEFSKTLNSGRLCFKWEPGCDETQMNKPPTFAQTTSYLGPSHWQALRFVCINLFLLIVLFWALIHNNYGLIRAPFWLKDSYLVPISLVVGLGCAWFYVYSYWGRDHPVGSSEDFRAVLAIAPPILLTALPAWVMAGQEYIKEHPLYRQLFVLGRGGASRFGGIYSFTRYDFQDWPIGALERHAPIYAGETPWSDDPRIGGRAIGLDSDSMMLTVAAMGGGKSLYAAWNNLLTWPGGAFILDPKGEHAQRCHQARSRNQSTAVHIIDPWGEVPHLGSSACFNPLDSIDLFHSNALDDINQIVVANIVREGAETGNSVHFRQNGQKVLRGVIAHVLSKFPKTRHNLPSIYDTFLMGTPDGVCADPEAFKSLIADMAVNEVLGKAPMDAAKVLLEAGDNERGSFVTTLATGLSWVNNPALRPILERSTFSMKSLKQKRETVFLVIPFEHLREHGRFVRTLISMGLIACREPASHPYKTLFLLDEFAQLGTFYPIKEGLVTLRSREIKIWMMLQNLGQLKENYDNFSDFMASCDKQFFAIEDFEDAELISNLLGEYTESWIEGEGSYKENRKPLRSAAEVREELRKGSGIQYLLPTDGLPMKLKLVPFHRNFPKRTFGPVRGNRFDQ